MVNMHMYGAQNVSKTLRDVGSRGDDIVRDGLRKAGALVERLAVDNVRSQLSRDSTGSLARSITHIVTMGWKPIARIGTSMIYGAIHEFGGDITPVKAEVLAIPVGDREGPAREHRDLEPAFGSKGIIGLQDLGGQLQYWFEDEVHIPERPYLRPALDDAEPLIDNIFYDAAEKWLRREGAV